LISAPIDARMTLKSVSDGNEPSGDRPNLVDQVSAMISNRLHNIKNLNWQFFLFLLDKDKSPL
jgi:hypothetical protein